MTAYILRRLLIALIVILLVTILIFFGMRILPGDPILIWYSTSELTDLSPAQIEQIREELGLNKPLVEQYFDWFNGVIHGDLGKSMRYQTSVLDEIMRRLPITLHLGGLAFLIGFIIGIPAGIICAVRRGSWLDNLITIFANFGITVPAFWLGIILVYIFALKLNWLPSFGYTSPFDDFWLSTRKIIMPVFCLAAFNIAAIARQTRSSMLEVMQQDYIRTAWSKGLREQAVIVRMPLKTALCRSLPLRSGGQRDNRRFRPDRNSLCNTRYGQNGDIFDAAT
jgi:peptide/nickel transport system permease protein